MEETPNTLTHTQCYQQSSRGHRLLWAWDPTYTLTHAHCYQDHPADTAFCGPGIPHTHTRSLLSGSPRGYHLLWAWHSSPVHTHTRSLLSGSPRGHRLLWPGMPSLASAEDSRVPHAAPLQAPTSLWRFHPPRQGQVPRSNSDGPRTLHLSPSQPQGDTQHDCPSPSISPDCGGGAPPV